MAHHDHASDESAVRGGATLSVVIPMYQEARRIADTLDDTVRTAREREGTTEILLVDDGCTDNTIEVVSPWVERDEVRLVRHERNQGKGAGVLTGLRESTGDWVLVMDADNSARLGEVVKLSDRANAVNAAMVIGSRAAKGADVEARATRAVSGLVFRLALKAIGMSLALDTQCGFKLYRRDAADMLVLNAQEQGFAFDIEHIAMTRRAGFTVEEVGIRWEHRDGGTISVWRDGPRMLADAWRIRKRLRGWKPVRPDTDTPEVVTRVRPEIAEPVG